MFFLASSSRKWFPAVFCPKAMYDETLRCGYCGDAGEDMTARWDTTEMMAKFFSCNWCMRRSEANENFFKMGDGIELSYVTANFAIISPDIWNKIQPDLSKCNPYAEVVATYNTWVNMAGLRNQALKVRAEELAEFYTHLGWDNDRIVKDIVS